MAVQSSQKNVGDHVQAGHQVELLKDHGAVPLPAAFLLSFKLKNFPTVDLDAALADLYAAIAADKDKSIAEVRALNDALLELGRNLVQINFTRHGMFRNEPAVPIPPLPDIEPALALPGTEGHERNVLITHVRRGVNRVAWAFESATKAALRAL